MVNPSCLTCFLSSTRFQLSHIPNVALTDQNTSVVNRLGQPKLENLGLETAFQEVLDLQTKDVIETSLGFVENTGTDETADKGVTLEKTARVLLVESKELTSGTTDVGERVSDPPDFTLVAETVFTSELELLVETLGLERTLGDLVGLRAVDLRHGDYRVSLLCLLGLKKNTGWKEKEQESVVGTTIIFFPPLPAEACHFLGEAAPNQIQFEKKRSTSLPEVTCLLQ